MLIDLAKFCDYEVHNLLLAFLLDLENLNVVVKNFAGEANVNGCLKFISREHPKLYASLLDGGDSLSDFLLELVLDCCSSE